MPLPDAPAQLLLLEADGGGRNVAFGLSWFALVGSHAPALARARARRLRATHYVVGGLGAVAGGCARLPAQARRRPVQAAAQAFAQRHPDGTVACIAPLPDGRWWLAAAQDGAVLARADRLYADAGLADAALQALAAQHPSLRRHDGPQTLAAVMASADPDALMVPVGSRWGRLPLPLRAFACVLAAALLVPQAWRVWQRPARVAAAPAIHAGLAWQQAAAQFRERQPVHPLPELGRVLASLHRLPLNVRGWLLRGARCEPGPSAWSCVADYSRSPGPATNITFERAVPAGWRVRFHPLDGAALHWAVPGHAATLAGAALPDAARIDGAVASALQRAAPAFSQILLGPPVAVAIAAPRDAHGQPLAPPPAGPALRQRALTLQGPLRSFALLADLPVVAAWSSLVLRLAAGRTPDTAVSVLTAELRGTLYEHAAP